MHKQKQTQRALTCNPSTGQGSGLYGSLKSGDLAAAAAAAPAAPAFAPPPPTPGATFVDIPLTGMRETIAKRLSAAKQTIPHYQLSVTVNVEKLLAMRKAVNERLAKEKSDVKVCLFAYYICMYIFLVVSIWSWSSFCYCDPPTLQNASNPH